MSLWFWFECILLLLNLTDFVQWNISIAPQEQAWKSAVLYSSSLPMTGEERAQACMLEKGSWGTKTKLLRSSLMKPSRWSNRQLQLIGHPRLGESPAKTGRVASLTGSDCRGISEPSWEQPSIAKAAKPCSNQRNPIILWLKKWLLSVYFAALLWRKNGNWYTLY